MTRMALEPVWLPMFPAIAADGIRRPAAPSRPISFFIMGSESESCLLSRPLISNRRSACLALLSQVCGVVRFWLKLLGSQSVFRVLHKGALHQACLQGFALRGVCWFSR